MLLLLGGLRDKPGKSADFYHTCYCLSGLSSAQHASNTVLGPPGVYVGNESCGAARGMCGRTLLRHDSDTARATRSDGASNGLLDSSLGRVLNFVSILAYFREHSQEG